MDDEKLLTLPETAETLGISMPTLGRLLRKGTIKAVKLNRNTRVRKTVLMKFIEGLKERTIKEEESVCA